MKILYATTNPGKIKEAQKNFGQYGYPVIGPADLGIDIEVAETGTTLAQNAVLKAEAYLPHVNPDTIVIGDDTGLSIDALGGEPGIKVRRWVGHKMTDEEIIAHCLKRMKGVPYKLRTATFHIALAVAKTGQQTKIFNGEYHTRIRVNPLSFREEGFPFRPLITSEKPMHRIRAIKSALPYLASLLDPNQPV